MLIKPVKESAKSSNVIVIRRRYSYLNKSNKSTCEYPTANTLEKKNIMY